MKYLMPSSPFQSNFININHFKIHYFDEGKGSPVLFCHGIPEWSMLYGEAIRLISRTNRAIVPDHLGFGCSAKVQDASQLTIEMHANRLVDFIRQLGISKVHLVVHDLGGPIGLAALVNAPDLFLSYSICNTFLWNLKNSAGAIGLRFFQSRVGTWLYLKTSFSVNMMARNGFNDEKIFKRFKDTFMFPHQTSEDRWANWQLMLNMLNEGEKFDQWLQKLKTSKIPGHIIWGKEDAFFNDVYLEKWKKELPELNTFVIDHCGHFPHLEAPEQFVGSIRDFIAKTENIETL